MATKEQLIWAKEGESQELTETACNEVHGIVVLEVESGPPNPKDISVEKPFATREYVSHEQSLDG